MIIFYEKATGKIRGTVDGRIHSKEHLKMWIGDKKKTGRIVIQWKPVKIHKDKDGKVIGADFEPDHPQKKIFEEIDQNPMKVYEYQVALKTKKLVKKVS